MNLWMKPAAIKSENGDFFTLCSINLNMASISGTGKYPTSTQPRPMCYKTYVV